MRIVNNNEILQHCGITETDLMNYYGLSKAQYDDYIAHFGIKGMLWGFSNGIRQAGKRIAGEASYQLQSFGRSNAEKALIRGQVNQNAKNEELLKKINSSMQPGHVDGVPALAGHLAKNVLQESISNYKKIRNQRIIDTFNNIASTPVRALSSAISSGRKLFSNLLGTSLKSRTIAAANASSSGANYNPKSAATSYIYSRNKNKNITSKIGSTISKGLNSLGSSISSGISGIKNSIQNKKIKQATIKAANASSSGVNYNPKSSATSYIYSQSKKK